MVTAENLPEKTMNRTELYRYLKTELTGNSMDSPVTDARLIIERSLDIKREALVIEGDVKVTDDQMALAREMLARRISGEPVSKILGHREFWGLDFEVTRDTLDPRPDSETLIEAVLQKIPDRSQSLRILDIGTGTGCLVISLLSELPNASGVAIDISSAELDVAARNLEQHGLKTRLTLQHCGWQDIETEDAFDIVISNPPYISMTEAEELSDEVSGFDPHIALFGGEDGLAAYRGIAKKLPELLNQNHGFSALEIGLNQAAEVSEIFKKTGFETEKLHRDLAGRDRCLIVKPAPWLKKSTKKLKK
jgi:release factor glutamine methyltransferase